jgi:hypothetical protein
MMRTDRDGAPLASVDAEDAAQRAGGEMVLDVTSMVLRHPDSGVRVTLDHVPAAGGRREHWRVVAHVDPADSWTLIASNVEAAKQAAQWLLPLAVDLENARLAATQAEAVLRRAVAEGAP